MKKICKLVCVVLLISIAVAAMCGTTAYAEQEQTKIRDVYMPATQIVNPPTVVQNVDSADKLSKLSDAVRPQAAWLSLTSDAMVKLDSSSVSLTDALSACDGKVIPILQIPDIQCADLVSKTIKDQYFDLMLASTDTAVLNKLLQDKITHTRLILISDEQDPQQLIESALPNGAMIIAQTQTTRETCEYLQQRFLSVMVMPGQEYDELNVRYAVDCGADFVVMDGFQTAYDMYATVQELTMVRRAYVIGHRGAPHYAPDNTVEGLHAAFTNGADAVEIDIWRTTDDRLICFHNNNLEGSTVEPPEDPKKPIIQYSYEELQQFSLLYTGNFYPSYTCKIPTLDDMLAALQKYPGKILVIELKDAQECATLIQPLLEEYDVADRCVFISFGSSYLSAQHAVNATLGASLLDSGYPKDDPLGCVDRYYKYTVGYPASYSPSYFITADAIAQLHCRGVNVNLWTAGNFTSMKEFAEKGAMFITTDAAEDEVWVRELYDNMSEKKVFSQYVSLIPKDVGKPNNTLPITEIVLYICLLLSAVAFGIAIMAKIYYNRKKH